MTAELSRDELFHVSINPDAEHTIVLLHGLLSSHLEYSFVIPHLNNYHLLIPDLPSHSRSAHIKPFSVELSSKCVSSLIEKHAHNRRAHVVGLSMGGFIALDLAKRYPAQVSSLFMTGAAPLTGWKKWMAERPSWVWSIMGGVLRNTPAWLYWKLCSWQGIKRHDELLVEMRANAQVELISDCYSTILELNDDMPAPNIRALTIAAGLQDDIESTRTMGQKLKETSSNNKAAVVKNAVHAWDLQSPELFAAGVQAWIEDRELPEEFELLE